MFMLLTTVNMPNKKKWPGLPPFPLHICYMVKNK